MSGVRIFSGQVVTRGPEPYRVAGRWHGMATRSALRSPARYLALYALAELTALGFLIWALGLGWALVMLAATFMVGVLLVASQVRGQITAARRSRTGLRSGDGTARIADGVLVGAGSFLVFLPGVLSTAVGIVMLAPVTRPAVRPLATAMVTRGLVRGVGVAGRFPYPPGRAGGHDYIDGEVIGGEVIDGEVVVAPASGRTGPGTGARTVIGQLPGR